MQFLFIVLAVIQSTLLIPIVLVIANYWDEDKLKGEGARQTLLHFICLMGYTEALAWFVSEVSLLSAQNGLSIGVEVEGTTLAINIIFMSSILLAVFSEIRLRAKE